MQIVNGVYCYGELEDNSNFSVVCADEDDDGIWLLGNIKTGKPFTTWESVVEVLTPYYNSPIQEISAV